MKSQILVKRYTQGLVQAIADDREFETLRQEMSRFVDLLESHEDLESALASPFLAAKKKNQIIEEILALTRLQEKSSRFIRLLLHHNRLAFLKDILAILPLFWNEKKGVSTFEVSSVIPLTEAQQEKLRKRLESLEKRPIRLTSKIDPELIGGLCLKKGNIIYDVSLKGNLLRLKEKISEG